MFSEKQRLGIITHSDIMAQTFNYDPIMLKVQRSMVAASGPQAILRAIQAIRAQGPSVKNAELVPLLRSLGSAPLQDHEERHLRTAFKADVPTSVDSERVIKALLMGLNSRRRKAVEQAFLSLTEGDSKATVDFSSSGDRLNATTTSNASAPSVQDAFAGVTVNFEGFVAVYTGIALAASHLNDDAFEVMILKDWAADGADRPRLHATERNWGATSTSGVDPLLSGSQASLSKDVLSRHLGKSQKAYDSSHMQRTFRPADPLPVVLPDYVTTHAKSFPQYESHEIKKADPFRLEGR